MAVHGGGSLVSTLSNSLSYTHTPSLLFATEDIEIAVKRKAEKKLRKKQYAAMNHWTLSLFGSEIQKKAEPSYLSVKWVNAIIGHGLFTEKKLAPLSFIGEYTGVVRPRKRRKDRLNDYVFGYVIGPHDTPWVIDAAERGNHTRFINHSDEPNLLSRSVITPDNIAHILFFTNRSIPAGGQLTVDYGPYYWRRRSQPHLL